MYITFVVAIRLDVGNVVTFTVRPVTAFCNARQVYGTVRQLVCPWNHPGGPAKRFVSHGPTGKVRVGGGVVPASSHLESARWLPAHRGLGFWPASYQSFVPSVASDYLGTDSSLIAALI